MASTIDLLGGPTGLMEIAVMAGKLTVNFKHFSRLAGVYLLGYSQGH